MFSTLQMAHKIYSFDISFLLIHFIYYFSFKTSNYNMENFKTIKRNSKKINSSEKIVKKKKKKSLKDKTSHLLNSKPQQKHKLITFLLQSLS